MLLKAHPRWRGYLRGDLQMHTVWSDGSADISPHFAILTFTSPVIRVAGSIITAWV
jgi:hypothetical protein